MATYAELLTVSTNEALINKIRVAVVIAAEVVRTEQDATPNHSNRLLWAKHVYANPDSEAQRMVWAVLAQNKDAPLAAIEGADDATVQAAVNAAIDVFATGA